MNSSRSYLEQFVQQAGQSVSPGALVLDAGAGDGRYQQYFPSARYESADLQTVDKPYGELTYVCDLSAIPVEAERYDLVLCTQVLEHVPEPRPVLRELHRTLKPGGKLWLTVPLFYPEHEVPYDFYRYTRYGIEHLLRDSGFDIEQIEWLEGYLGTLSYQSKAAAQALPSWAEVRRKPWPLLPLFPATALLRSALGAVSYGLGYADTRHKITSRGHCKNYRVVAAKSVAAQGVGEGG